MGRCSSSGPEPQGRTVIPKLDAIPSDDTILSATASSIAVAGTYSLEVTSLAQAQKLVAAGQSSSTAAIGDGTPTTITFDFGTINGGTLTGNNSGDNAANTTSNAYADSKVADAINNRCHAPRSANDAAAELSV